MAKYVVIVGAERGPPINVEWTTKETKEQDDFFNQLTFAGLVHLMPHCIENLQKELDTGQRIRVGISADLVLASSDHGTAVLGGVALCCGITQGLLATTVADLRGTAFGLFNLMSESAFLVASSLAGLIWDRFGDSSTFLAGAPFCMLALAGWRGTRPP